MFVTNWISPTKIQKISEITNFFRHYFLSRTEVYKGQLPILNFYYAPSHGKYISENYRLMVYDKQTLYKWHSNNLLSPNEKTSAEDKKPVGDFHFFQNQWILINRRLPDMYDATNKKPIGIGEYVPLTEGRQILLDKSQGGRLIVVQLVNN